MGRRPKQLLVTRPSIDQAQTCEALKAIGIEPVSSPVMAAERLAFQIPRQKWQAIVVTSRNALRVMEPDEFSSLTGIPVFCVGKRTEALALELGLEVAATFPDMTQLARELPPTLNVDSGPLLYLTARHRSGGLKNALESAGLDYCLLETYEMRPELALTEEAVELTIQGNVDGVLLYSQRTASLFLSLAEKSGIAEFVNSLTYYCLSEAVSSPIKEAGYPLVVAEAPNETSLLECVKKDRN